MHETARTFGSSIAVGRQATPARTRALLVIGSAFLLAAPLALVQPAAHWARDPELLQLLRGMAGIKGVLAALAFTVVWWRLGRASGPGSFAATCIGSVWALALSTGLLWQVTAVPAASVLFHCATITLLVTAWRDVSPTTGETRPPAPSRRPPRSASR